MPYMIYWLSANRFSTEHILIAVFLFACGVTLGYIFLAFWPSKKKFHGTMINMGAILLVLGLLTLQLPMFPSPYISYIAAYTAVLGAGQGRSFHSDFQSNQFFSAHARSLSKATCQVLWLKFPLGLSLTWANSIGSGETAQMRRLACIFAVRIWTAHSYIVLDFPKPHICICPPPSVEKSLSEENKYCNNPFSLYLWMFVSVILNERHDFLFFLTFYLFF